MIFENVLSRPDGSYVIDRNGLPYHVPNEGEFESLWQQVNTFALENPELVKPEPPPEPPPAPTSEELLARDKIRAANILTAYVHRQAAQTGDFTPEEFAIIAKAGFLDAWEPDKEYIAGMRLAYSGNAYEVIQGHTSFAKQPPGDYKSAGLYKSL